MNEKPEIKSETSDRVRLEREVRPPATADKPWWCPTCHEWIAGSEVTFEETHDARLGGCGNPVE